MKFCVKTLRKAEADIRSITKYIYDRSPQGASAWLDALDALDAYRKARSRLETTAYSCALADENEHFEIEVRQALFKTKLGRIYRMLFTIVGEEVRILRIRGPGQAPVFPEELGSSGDE